MGGVVKQCIMICNSRCRVLFGSLVTRTGYNFTEYKNYFDINNWFKLKWEWWMESRISEYWMGT